MTRREVSASAFDYLCVEMVNDALERAWTRRERDDVEASARADDVHVRADVRDDATVAAACETLARTGERIGERCAERATRGMDPFADEQSAIMCACKEFWTQTHGKRADALKTNNKGTFVFHDDSFRAMRGVVGGARGRGTSGTTGERLASDASASSSAAARASSDAAAAAAAVDDDPRVRAYLALHAGIIRGGLRALGVRARVRGELRATSASSSAARGDAVAARDPPAVAFTVDVVRATDPRDEENS